MSHVKGIWLASAAVAQQDMLGHICWPRVIAIRQSTALRSEHQRCMALFVEAAQRGCMHAC